MNNYNYTINTPKRNYRRKPPSRKEVEFALNLFRISPDSKQSSDEKPVVIQGNIFDYLENQAETKAWIKSLEAEDGAR